jgi:hypothetical protein
MSVLAVPAVVMIKADFSQMLKRAQLLAIMVSNSISINLAECFINQIKESRLTGWIAFPEIARRWQLAGGLENWLW